MRPSPDEFVPLPWFPWDSRPDTVPLDTDEIATALYLANGDLQAAAALLKVTVAQLKKPIRKTPRLQQLIERLRERAPIVTEIRQDTSSANA
jgi:hypothetical protein